MGIIKEFKEFAIKGNLVDIAIGLIIGAAFGKVVTSFVEDIIMPPLGMILGGTDFSNLKITLKEAAIEGGQKVDPVTINYGNFIQIIIDFLIIAAAVFVVIKLMNTIKKKEAEETATLTTDQVLLTEIRDALKNRP